MDYSLLGNQALDFEPGAARIKHVYYHAAADPERPLGPIARMATKAKWATTGKTASSAGTDHPAASARQILGH